jgi:hypothetical protein
MKGMLAAASLSDDRAIGDEDDGGAAAVAAAGAGVAAGVAAATAEGDGAGTALDAVTFECTDVSSCVN